MAWWRWFYAPETQASIDAVDSADAGAFHALDAAKVAGFRPAP